MNIGHAKRVLAYQEKIMANELKPLSNIPHHVLARMQGRIAEPIKDAIVPGGAQPNHISIRGNRFTLINSDGEKIELNTTYMDVLIVGHNPSMSQAYYQETFDPSAVEFKPPDCWSDNGIGPSTSAGKPQSPTCAVCEKRAWGSDVSKLTGKGKPACQASRKLAVYYGDTVYQLKVTPGSFKSWNSYLNYLGPKGVQNPLKYDDVITRVSFAGTGTLKFEPVPGDYPYAPQEAFEMMDKLREEQVYRDVLGLDDKPIEGDPKPYVSSVEKEAQEKAAAANPLWRSRPDLGSRMYPQGEVEPSIQPQPGYEPPGEPMAAKRSRRRKENGEAVEAPQEAPQPSQDISDKVKSALNFKFTR